MRLLVGICLLTLSFTLLAKDVRDSSDHPLLTRYPGSQLFAYEQKDFEEYMLPLSKAEKSVAGKIQFAHSKKLEGKLTRIGYRLRGKTSSLKIYRNYEQALKNSNFKTLFECKEKACGSTPLWQHFFPGNKFWSNGKNRLLIAHKNINNQDVYITLYVAGQPGQVMTALDVVEVKQMQTGLVEINADSLLQKLEQEGKVALYGIQFEIDKATLLDKSQNTIAVLASVLTNNPSLKVYIVGHTSDSGPLQHNVSLSKQRATAVLHELVNKYKIASSRLSVFGAGPYAPVATNQTDSGRAQNRRVEIIKRLQ